MPGSALAVAQLMNDAGVPEGAYVNVFASHDQIETMIADPRVAGVSLTGSERAGAVVAAIAGRNLKKCVLELGGSDPYVILDTDDVRAAADAAWETRISNTGQACNSNKRMIVMDDVFDGFVARLTEHAKDLRPGDPTAEDEHTFAPLSSRAAAEALAEQVQDAVSKGATLHAGGVLGEPPAAYFSRRCSPASPRRCRSAASNAAVSAVSWARSVWTSSSTSGSCPVRRGPGRVSPRVGGAASPIDCTAGPC